MAKKSNRRLARQPTETVGRASRSQSATSRSQAEPKGSNLLLTTLAATWCVFAMLDLALNVLVSGGALHNGQIPFGARFSLVSYGIVVLTGFLFIFGGFLIFLARTASRLLPAGSPIRWTTRLLLTLFVWLFVLLYGSSWAKFWQMEVFLSYDDFAFIAPHPLQVFHWVDRDSAIGVVVSTLIAAAVLSEGIPRWVASWRPATQRRLVLTSGTAVGLFLVMTLFGELYSGWGERRYMPLGILYATNRDNALGPFAYVLADIRRHIWTPTEELGSSDSPQIIQRPIIPMEQYLAGVDRRRVKPWNVIVLIVESLRADQLRAYGGSRDVMPAVDALAREGRVFSNAYSEATFTTYATLVPLSAHYPLRSTELYNYPKDPTYPRVLIYDVLKPLGYHTAIFSSSNENWGGMINYLETGHVDRFFHAATFSGPTYDTTMPGETTFADFVKATKNAGSLDDRFTVGESMRWIDSLDSKPFFIYMNLQNSHLPYIVPKDFPRRFSPAKLDFTIRFRHFPKDKIDVVKDVYADSLSYVDSQIARLFQHLRQRGLWDRTVIVLTGDHGQGFYEHGFAAHSGPLFNELMKVPIIIRAPGLQPSIDPRPTQHVDVPPSILELLGLPSHPSFQGISLFDPHVNPNRSLYMVVQTPLAHQYGIVRSRYKLIYDEWQRRHLLYDLASDPAEKIDLASEKPTVVKELAQRLHAWRRAQLDYYKDKKVHTREYPPILPD